MSEHAFIKHIEYHLPEATVTNHDIQQKFPEWDAQKIFSKIGIEERRIAGDNESAADLAVKAAKKLFEKNDVLPASIDYLLFCTQSPDYFLPTTACIIQDRLGLPTNVGAIDFNQGCSGYIYGLSLAKGLLMAGIAKNVLLLTGETYSKYIGKDDKGNMSIFGDAASATLISDNGFFRIEQFALGSDGSGYQNLIVKNGASRFPHRSSSVNTPDDFLVMNGPEIFNFTIDRIPQLITDVLIKNNLTVNNVSQFVFHQANKFILDHLGKKMNLPKEKTPQRMADCGNTVSSTIPITICGQLSANGYNKGENWLLAGFGVGYSWGGVIVRS